MEKEDLKSKKLSVKNLMFGAMIGAVIGIIAFAPIWLRNNGQLMDYGDYFLQLVPFTSELKRMIVSGSLSWSWNSFLGDSFIKAYSYYTVFNPFAWILALFPDAYILYGTMFVTILKLSISMVGAMLYMRRFCKNDMFALIGALLYTFSGFTLINTNFYFFLDVIAVFPFMMYGLECLISKRKGTIYVISLALNAAINYYFFVSTVMLTVIYVIFRLELYKISGWKKNWKAFKSIFLYSVLGTGMAAGALIPSFYAILGSGKAAKTIGTQFRLMYWPQNIFERLRTLVAPIESGRYHAFFDSSTWSSTGIYLPVFGCMCVLQWCIRKKDWIKKICVLLIVCYFVPVLNSAFNLFSSIGYTRWLYGMALLFSLVTVLTLEEVREQKQILSKKICFILTIFAAGLQLVPSAIYYLYKNGIPLLSRFADVCTNEHFMGYSAILVMIALTSINYAGLWYIVCMKNLKTKRLTWCIVFACVLNFFVYNEINYDLHATDYSNEYYFQKTLVEGTVKDNLYFEYRIDYPGQIANYSLFKNMPGVNYYNSLQNPNATRFAETVGIGENLEDTILLTPTKGSEYTDALLSVKYYYDYDGNAAIPDGFNYLHIENGVDIYENENYIPMGFIYDSYILESQLEGLLPEEKALAMLNSMVIQAKDEEFVGQYLTKEGVQKDLSRFPEMVTARQATVCKFFEGTSSGFTAGIELDKGNIVFFSILNDPGWQIYVNGNKAKVIEANCGLLGIYCNEGSNTITATYHTQGWKLGIFCSVFCLVLWFALELIISKLKMNKIGGGVKCSQ